MRLGFRSQVTSRQAQRDRFFLLRKLDNGTNRAGSAYLRVRVTETVMMTLILWCILLVLCWPLAILALVLYPIVWLLLLPLRLVGIAVGGALDLIRAIIFLPARILRGPRRSAFTRS